MTSGACGRNQRRFAKKTVPHTDKSGGLLPGPAVQRSLATSPCGTRERRQTSAGTAGYRPVILAETIPLRGPGTLVGEFRDSLLRSNFPGTPMRQGM